MVRNGFLLAVIGSAWLVHPVMAQATGPGSEVAPQLTSPVTSHTQNVVFEYTARKMLGFVSEARVALQNRNDHEARADMDAAMNQLNSIKDTRNYLEMMGVQFGQVLYGDSNSYFIPIADDTYAVRSYASGPFWSPGKTMAVRDVKLVSVDIAINPDMADRHLRAAQQKLGSAESRAADHELKALLDESIHESAATGQPLVRLQDNIYLTRVLIRQQNYRGARFALRNARAALADYETSVSNPQRRADIGNLHQEIDALDGTIQKHDPTLLKQAENTVEKWWNNLKGWTKDKTS